MRAATSGVRSLARRAAMELKCPPDEPIVDFTVAAHDFRAVLHGFEVEKTLVCGVGDGQFAGISVGGRNFGPAVFQNAFSVEVEPCSERSSLIFQKAGAFGCENFFYESLLDE